MLTERGFASTRVTDVAEAIGISPALVFYHFDSKEQLFAEAFAWAVNQDFEALQEIANSDGTPTDRLRRMLQVYAPPGASRGWTLWIDAWATALRDPQMRKVSRRLDANWQRALAEVISAGVARGEFHCADPGAAAWKITSLLDGLAIQVVVHRGLVTYRQMREWGRQATAAELGIPSDRLG